PFWLKKIPVRTKLTGIHRLRVVRNILADIAEEDEDVLVFRVDVMVLPLPPFGLVYHFRKDQGGANRVQYLRAIKDLIGRGRSANVSIDEKLSRPEIGRASCRERV